MNDSDNREHPHAKLGAVRKLIVGFVIFCALLLSLDLIAHRHLSFAEGLLPVEGWFGFYAVYGFVSCTLVVQPANQLLAGSTPPIKLTGVKNPSSGGEATGTVPLTAGELASGVKSGDVWL